MNAYKGIDAMEQETSQPPKDKSSFVDAAIIIVFFVALFGGSLMDFNRDSQARIATVNTMLYASCVDNRAFLSDKPDCVHPFDKQDNK